MHLVSSSLLSSLSLGYPGKHGSHSDCLACSGVSLSFYNHLPAQTFHLKPCLCAPLDPIVGVVPHYQAPVVPLDVGHVSYRRDVGKAGESEERDEASFDPDELDDFEALNYHQLQALVEQMEGGRRRTRQQFRDQPINSRIIVAINYINSTWSASVETIAVVVTIMGNEWQRTISRMPSERYLSQRHRIMTLNKLKF